MIGSVLVSTRGTEDAGAPPVPSPVSQAAPCWPTCATSRIAELRALTTPLTGLPNKRAVADSLKRMVAQAQTASPMAAVLLDLDHFKVSQRRFGHAAVTRPCRVGGRDAVELATSDFAGRNGGEEFSLILPERTRPVLRCAEKLFVHGHGPT